MRRIPAIAAIALVFAFGAVACDGDNDATGDGTVTPLATAPATEPAETPEPTGEATPDGEAAITIDSPELGDIVTVPFDVSGTANVFEAALSVQVLTDDGRLLCQHNIMATAGSGTRGDWATTLAFPPLDAPEGQVAVPGVIRAFNYSARDGSEENVVTLNVNLSSERPAVVIEEPTCLQEVSATGSFEVSGYARAFEGALNLEMVDSQGNVVLERNVQAASGIGEAPWSVTIDLSAEGLEPGVYELIAFDYSAEDGSRQNDFAIPIVLTP